MGDRTAHTAHTAHIKIAAPLREELIETLGSDAETSEVTDGFVDLVFTDTYVGFSEELAVAVEEFAEERGVPVAYDIWQDPVYEYLSTQYVKAPGRARFSADCDASGNVVLAWDQVEAALGSADPACALRALYGRYAIEAYQNFDPDAA